MALTTETLNVPHWVVGVLTTLKAIDPHANAAGGFFRDRDNGRAVKDLDVFLHTERRVELLRLMGSLGFAATVYSGADYFEHEPTVVDAEMFEHEDGIYLPVNVIRLTTPTSLEQNLVRFDFGICRIGTDGEKVVCSTDYEIDQRLETFTLLRCESEQQYARSMDRYERISQKYADWELVVPEEFKKFEPALELFDDAEFL